MSKLDGGLVLAAAFAFVAARPVAAETATVYDLASLAWKATDIVEAEIIGPDRPKNGPAPTLIRVSKIYKGDWKAGETRQVFFLNGYRVAEDRWIKTSSLGPGDDLLLFVGEIPTRTAIYTPAYPEARPVVPSGIRWVVDGRAVPFVQFDNPGGVIAVRPGKPGSTSPPTLDEFRRQTIEAVERAESLAERLDAAGPPDEGAKLLDLLRDRADDSGQAGRGWPADAFAEAACTRLANLHDVERLDEAAFLRLPSWACLRVLTQGFASPEGRDFLLNRVSDDSRPVERRVRYAEMLRDVGRDYHAVASNIRPGGWSSGPVEAKDNAEFITRVARAAEAAPEGDVRAALLDALVRFSQALTGRPDDDPIRADLRGTLPVLEGLYRRVDSERAKFDIEQVVARTSRTAYDRLGSPCGPMLTIVTAAARGRAGDRRLTLRADLVTLAGSPGDPPTVVLRSRASGEARSLPFVSQTPWSEHRRYETASGHAVLPADLPPGRYRVSLRFGHDGRVVSEGHGFEADL